MTKIEILKYSDREIRQTPTLYAEFQRLYREENGTGCASCNMKKALNSWRRTPDTIIKTRTKMEKAKNTFLLKNPNMVLHIGNGTYLKSDSADEVALEFINYEGSKYKEFREKKFFTKLPDAPKKARKPRAKKAEKAEVKETKIITDADKQNKPSQPIQKEVSTDKGAEG